MLGENEKNILLLWDAPVKGQRIFYSVWECLEKQHIPINHILYLYCEANYKNDAFRDRGNKQANTGGLNTKERVAALEQYFSGSTVVFEPLMLSERELPIESVDEIPVVQKAIERHVFPQLIKHNPKSLHVTLASGTTEMVFAWISLYTSATFTRTFGDSVTLWRFSDNTVKTDSGKTKYSTLYKLDMPINPYIGIAAQEAFDFTETSTIDMDGNGQIKRNSVLNAPLLLLGERGIGKSTVVETTVYAEKENRGLVQDTDKTCYEMSIR